MPCRSCGNQLQEMKHFISPPILHVLHININKTNIDKEINIYIADTPCIYKLKGIIYFGGAHFTSRIINQSGEVWYHDGIATGRELYIQWKTNRNSKP